MQDNLVHQYPLARRGLPTFVMDVLKAAMDEASSVQYQRIDAQFSMLPKLRDADLVAPWEEAEASMEELLAQPEEGAQTVAKARRDALGEIKRQVVRVYELSSTLMRPSSSTSRASEKANRAEFTNYSIEHRQDLLRRVSLEFVSGPDRAQMAASLLSKEEVARLRASYAYLYDWSRKPGGTRFPWNVAMRELGVIKLSARGELKPLSQDFYEKMQMRKL